LTATETEPQTETGELLSGAQLRKLNVLLSQAGLKDRSDALTWLSGQLGYEVTSRNNLTSTEASTLIDLLADGEVRIETRENEEDKAPSVFTAVRNVMTDIGHVGVGKTGRNVDQNYSFRSIDAFVDKLSPILSKHGVIVVPSVRSFERVEKPTKSGGLMTTVYAHVDFTIYGPRGDSFPASIVGAGADTSDKSANKAMTAAYKYCLAQVFAVPNVGWQEGDNDTPEVSWAAPPQQSGNDDLILRIEDIAAEQGASFEAFTAKVRNDNGNLTVEQFKQAPRSLVQAFLGRVERHLEKMRQAAEAEVNGTAPPQS
jgi:hypothetical protein